MKKNQKFTVTSYISINGAPYVSFDSLTPEQKQYACDEVGRRIARTIENYISLHPEEADQIIQALLKAGSKLMWEEKIINGRKCRIEYENGDINRPKEPIWLE